MKKILSILVSIAMVMSLMVVSAVAVSDPTVTVEKVTEPAANVGDTVTLAVSIANNPGFNKCDWNIIYDTSKLELVGMNTSFTASIPGVGNFVVDYLTSANPELTVAITNPATGKYIVGSGEPAFASETGVLFTLDFVVQSVSENCFAEVAIESVEFEGFVGDVATAIDAEYVAGGVNIAADPDYVAPEGGETPDNPPAGGETPDNPPAGGDDTGDPTLGGGTTGGSTTGGSTTGGSTTGGSTTGGSTTGGSTTGGSTTGGSTTGGSTTGGSTTGGSTTGGSTTGGSTTGGSTTGGSTTGGSTTGGSTTGGDVTPDTPEVPDTPVVVPPVVEEPCKGGEECPAYKFGDVDTTKWYHEGIHYVVENGLMIGIDEDEFAPNGITTRAMVVMILYRLEGMPACDAENVFSDVEDDWYTDAIVWAAANEVVRGYGDGTFGPDDVITREQLAQMIYNYLEYKGYDVSATDDLSAFADAADVSVWAETAVKHTVAAEIVKGTDKGLEPLASADRAQTATFFARFCKNVLK